MCMQFWEPRFGYTLNSHAVMETNDSHTLFMVWVRASHPSITKHVGAFISSHIWIQKGLRSVIRWLTNTTFAGAAAAGVLLSAADVPSSRQLPAPEAAALGVGSTSCGETDNQQIYTWSDSQTDKELIKPDIEMKYPKPPTANFTLAVQGSKRSSLRMTQNNSKEKTNPTANS